MEKSMIKLENGVRYLSEIQTIYFDSFPAEERREWKSFSELAVANESAFDVFAVVKDDKCIGFLSYWKIEEFYYIEHFAIARKHRMGGIGSRVLEMFKEKVSKAMIVLEAELPDTELSKRRLGFYQRHGFAILSKDYMQPPYGEGLPSVPLYLMGCGAGETDIKRIGYLLHKVVYGVDE